MKKLILLIAILLISVATFGQKKDSRFKKYEFKSEQEAKDSIASLRAYEIEHGRLTYGIVELGFLVTNAGEYDEDGNEIKPPKYSNKYSIDVFWIDEEKEGWKGKKIKLNGNKSSHTFSGIDYEDDTEN